MKIAYLALAVYGHEKHAGYTHPFHLSRALSIHADVSLFFSGTAHGIKTIDGLKIVELCLPTSDSLCINPIELIRSSRLASSELHYADVIHERFRFNPLDLLLVKNRKYILEFNDILVTRPKGYLGIMRKHVLSRKLDRCDAIVTQTETLRDLISRISRKPVFVVPNGVDTSFFSPRTGGSVRRRYGISEDDILVAYTGSFRPWHGLEIITRSAEAIRRYRKNVKFILVGESGTDRTTNIHGHGSNVLFTGTVSVETVPEILASSDICVAPFSSTHFDPINELGFWWCPMKLFEYMSCGKPTVATDYAEVKKIVGNSALLFSPNDTEDFIDKLTTLIDDEHLRKELGKRARTLAVKNHTWKQRADELLNVYNAV
jgi:glycosyltransferase involved in cell wall biosynthesis